VATFAEAAPVRGGAVPHGPSLLEWAVLARRQIPTLIVFSLLLASACKSREHRVCEHVTALQAERVESLGADPGDPKQNLERCLEMQTEIGANDNEWNAYLDCAEKAKAWGDVESCLVDLGITVGKRKSGL
jgi:hypothetical protein